MLAEMCHLSGGMVWRKDAEGRYLFASMKLCAQIFNLRHCDDVVGLTDREVIDRYFSQPHTIVDACVASDQHTILRGGEVPFR